MSIRLLSATFLVLGLGLTSAQAVTASVDGLPLVLPEVPGLCYLDATADPADRTFLSTWGPLVGEANRLVAAFTDCTALDSWRRGQSGIPASYGLLMVSLRDGSVKPVRAARSIYLDALAEDVLSTPGASRTDSALFVPGFVQYDTETGPMRMASVQALTLSAGLPVTVTAYGPSSDTAQATLLTAQTEFVAALVAANPEGAGELPAAAPPAEPDWSRMVGLGFIGLGLGAAVALFVRWRRRQPKP